MATIRCASRSSAGAVIDLLPEFGDLPDILHCNDWETALAILYLKNDAVLRPELSHIKTVYTIHNIAYRGAVRQKRDGSDVRSAGWLVSWRPEL
ncbi:MAG: glycogen/starch synthase [Oscillospiraceae bacterium]